MRLFRYNFPENLGRFYADFAHSPGANSHFFIFSSYGAIAECFILWSVSGTMLHSGMQ